MERAAVGLAHFKGLGGGPNIITGEGLIADEDAADDRSAGSVRTVIDGAAFGEVAVLGEPVGLVADEGGIGNGKDSILMEIPNGPTLYVVRATDVHIVGHDVVGNGQGAAG